MAKKMRSRAVTQKTMSRSQAELLKKEAESIIDRGGAPSMKEILALSRKSGRNYKDVLKIVNDMKKKMDAERQAAEERGEVFSAAGYLKNAMDVADNLSKPEVEEVSEPKEKALEEAEAEA